MKRIATLIPAYKVEYLNDLFVCLKIQTYKNFEILLSDDSPGGRVTERLQMPEFKSLLAGMDLKVIPGPQQGAYRNLQHLMRTWNGRTDLFHVLCDDDVVYPRFYEYHSGVHETPGVAVTVSKRWTAQDSGMPIATLTMPPEIERNMSRVFLLDSNQLFKSVVPLLRNWLGEFSNAVIARELASLALTRRIGDMPFMGTADLGIGDIAFFLQASLTHKLVFLHEYLGFFRINPHQHTGQLPSRGMKEQFLGWGPIAIASMQLGKLTPQEAFSAFKVVEWAMGKYYPDDEDMKQFAALIAGHAELTPAFIARFGALWQTFLDAGQSDLSFGAADRAVKA